MRPGNAVATATVIATSLLAGACAGMPEHSEPGPVLGCHYFVQDQAARDLQLPWGVRLHDDALTGWPAIQQRDGVRRATTLTGTGEVDFPFGYWIRTAQDSIELGYPGGGGLLLELAVADTTMRGTARAVGDATPPPAAAPAETRHDVELVRARCPDDA
jgi:hypothetical protein